MLRLRTAIRLDVSGSSAEYLYGTTLCIPGEFCLTDDFSPYPQIFLDEFCEYMKEIKAIPVAHK